MSDMTPGKIFVYGIGIFLLIMVLSMLKDCNDRYNAEVQIALDKCVSAIGADDCMKLRWNKDINFKIKIQNCLPQPTCSIESQKQQENNILIPYKRCIEAIGTKHCDQILK